MLFLLPILHTIPIDTECLEKLGRISRQVFASIASIRDLRAEETLKRVGINSLLNVLK